MRIKTETLQEMVNKAIKGASMNKMIPITNLMGIYFNEGNLLLMTADGRNHLRVHEDIKDENISESSFYTVVNADTFAKLVGKTTKEYIELENKDSFLEVSGNGVYKLELAINEDGELIKFPEIIVPTDAIELSINSLKESLERCKSSVAKTMEIPCLTGYYLGDNVISTDRKVCCIVNNKLIASPLLISNETAELLSLLEGDKVMLSVKDNNLTFKTDKLTISTKELEGKEIYPVAPVTNLLSLEYNKTVSINKLALLDVLDRMSLFISDYDKNGIYLTFTKDGLMIRSQKSNAEELLSYTSPVDIEEEFTCLIDIEMLKAHIQLLQDESVAISYGQSKMIKIVENDVVYSISLLSEVN